MLQAISEFSVKDQQILTFSAIEEGQMNNLNLYLTLICRG